MPRKFDFISPDIVLNEVDESVLPVEATEVGPLLIGQTERGPAMKPVRVTNLSDLYAIFGNPISGRGTSDLDVWREGNKKVPTYAMYAAQAHLAANSTPVTMVRLLGEADSNQSSGTRVGWKLNGKSEATVAANTTAYGLFIMPSASATTNPTGSLAAIFYATGSSLLLSGSDSLGNAGQKATAQLIESTAGGKFTMIVSSSSGEGNSISFSFDPNAEDFIRNRFNTNPQKIEASDNFGTTNESYWLGETFEQAATDDVSGGSVTGDQYGVLLPLQKGSLETGNWAYHEFDSQQAKTGYFLNRKVGGTRAKLFRLVAHSAGEWESKNLHVEIGDLRVGNSQNPNSSFTVKIMNGKQILERFSNCNLDLTSENFIAKKIGDQYLDWDATNKKYNVRGEYANVSDYVYVELDAAVANQTLEDSFALPVGFEGPLQHKGWSFRSGSADVETKAAAPSAAFTEPYILGGNGIASSGAPASNLVGGLVEDFTGSLNFPSLRLTSLNTNQGGNYAASSVFGVRHYQGSTTYRDASYGDILRVLPNNVTAAGNSFELSFTFSLEEIAASNGLYYFNEGVMGYGEGTGNTLQSLFNLGVKQYRAPMVGGSDGVDIKKVSPFSDYHIGGSDTSVTNYVKHTIEKALDTVADSEVVEYEIIAMPGMTDTTITNRMIQICEDRGDAMAVVDLDGIYRHEFEAASQENGAASDAISTANTRLINSSYVATYYPSVRITDTANGGNNVLIVPPSVAAIGAIAKSQGTSEPWFAPAGFNRGGINELGGSNGPRVNGTLEHLTKADRDNLYEVNINPIARFPASGNIVIFGQKTMQQNASALDRINVRRLLLHLKRRIGNVAETILFDQNVQATWNRFKFQADQILSDVQSRLGITEYKLVLDETTTTADLVDRNILYAKVLIKPASAIEFIVVDFVVTRSGIEL